MKTAKEHNSERIAVIGVKSKISEFLFKHPWQTTILFIFVIELLVLFLEKDIGAVIKSMKIIVPILIANVLIVRFFTKSYCYKVSINKNINTIRFFLMFDKGIIEEIIKDVTVIIDKNCKIAINNKLFVVFPFMIHKVVGFLPKDTEIQYVGFFGKLKKKDWDKTNRRLEPGIQ